MSSDFIDQLKSRLPAGEWSGLSFVPNPGGMMQDRGAVHATAVHTRTGQAAYLKILPVRGDSATEDTRKFVGRPRLERLRTRMVAARDASLPIARVIACEFIETPESLILAMEQVQPLSAIIRNGGRDDLAIQILSTFDPEHLSGWYHFDICPKNTGLTKDNRCVLIDLDSLCVTEQGRVDVSIFAFKLNRVPRELIQRFASGTAHPPELVRAKHATESLLLAAECSLGPVGGRLEPADVEHWLNTSTATQTIKQLWRPYLLGLAEAKIPRFADILASYQATTATRSSAEAPTPKQEALEPRPSVPIDASVQSLDGLELDRATSWEALEPWRRSVRRAVLSIPELKAYRVRVAELARHFPQDERYWGELAFVLLCHELDADLAEELLREALQHHPESTDLKATLQLARMWRRD